ncbi:MAG: hypothetical protein KDK04_06175 [Candidatus Competibacteraceae bacterium]|nr:hypothetical protein [Candidatus Competibacteraceae bacterium]
MSKLKNFGGTMKRLILAIALVVSSVAYAGSFDRLFEGRPLWYSEDQSVLLWVLESDGIIVGHLLRDGRMHLIESIHIEMTSGDDGIPYERATLQAQLMEWEDDRLVTRNYATNLLSPWLSLTKDGTLIFGAWVAFGIAKSWELKPF